jgi:hypothetical protein
MARTLLAPQTTPLDPNSPIEPVNSSPPPRGGPPNPTPVPGITPLNPAFRSGPPKPTPVPGVPGTTTTASATPGVPTQPATGITQLPDGAGGAIPVPPPSVTGPPPNPTPLPTGPGWEGGLPGTATGDPSVTPTSTFGKDNNLINTQINPAADPRLLKLQGMQDSSLERILNGPDRNAMARDQYSTWEAATAPDFEHSITDATDAAAAHGQIRSGQLTNRYGDLARQRVLDQTTARNQYMQQALEGSIGDTQRGFEDVSGAAGTAFNQGLTGREELRGERGYQRSRAEQALINRIRQQQAEQGAEAQSFGEGTTAYGLGMEGDPTGALQGASAQASDEAAAAAGDTGALLRLLAQRRGQTAANTAAA